MEVSTVNSNTTQIEGILFDLDGTLTNMDIRLVNPFRSALEKVSGKIPSDETIEYALEDILAQVGQKSRMRMVKIMWNIARKVGLSRFKSVYFLILTMKYYQESKYKFEALENAETNIRWALAHYEKVAIVTSASKKAVEKAKEQVQILKKIDVVITDDDVDHPKPSPDPILLACQKLNLQPQNTIYIGDLSTDIVSGRRAGTKTMGVLGMYGKYTKSLMKREKPDFIVKNLNEVLKTLQGFKPQLA